MHNSTQNITILLNISKLMTYRANITIVIGLVTQVSGLATHALVNHCT